MWSENHSTELLLWEDPVFPSDENVNIQSTPGYTQVGRYMKDQEDEW